MKIFHPKYTALVALVSISGSSYAQLPQNIEPGQNQKSVSVFEQPEYLALIIILFVILVGYYIYKRKKNNSSKY